MASSASFTDSAAPARARWSRPLPIEGELRHLVTAEPAFVVAADMHVTAWNRAIERLTGVPAGQAIGRSCYEVVSAISHGAMPRCCRYACPLMRATQRGWPSERFPFTVAAPTGPVQAELGTVGGGTELMHLLLVSPASARRKPDAITGHAMEGRHRAGAVLTPRQTEVLRLLGDGVTCQGISQRLVISTATTRNHIRAILRELGAHSQLEAVSEARRRGLV